MAEPQDPVRVDDEVAAELMEIVTVANNAVAANAEPDGCALYSTSCASSSGRAAHDAGRLGAMVAP